MTADELASSTVTVQTVEVTQFTMEAATDSASLDALASESAAAGCTMSTETCSADVIVLTRRALEGSRRPLREL
eukprot:4159376-Prymnesium_polylepis.1